MEYDPALGLSKRNLPRGHGFYKPLQLSNCNRLEPLVVRVL